MKTIWFVVRGYPTQKHTSFAFLQPVIRGIADQGIKCVVFAPQTVNGKSNHGMSRPTQWEDITEKGNKITIIQPKYISLPGLMVNGVQLNIWERERVLSRALKAYAGNGLPDVIYAHFWDCAMMAANFCLKNNIPLVAVCGESKVDIRRYYAKERLSERLKAVKGVICVSTKNKKECEALGLITESSNVIVSPNAIDTSMFYKKDKAEAKKKLGLSDDDFTISYVGRYSERKGVNRLIEAAKSIPAVKLILIGYSGELIPSDQIHIAKRVPHEEVVEYLNASDVYCLPTMAEGCCNSIVEAMACGLPIVSSNLEFNDDIIDSENSIRIDPQNVEEIAKALKTLRDDEKLRAKMGEKSLEMARGMTIHARIEALLAFIQSVIEK